MKLGNLVLAGLVVWTGYELYKNHTMKATTNAMKNDPSKVHLPPYPFIFSKTLSALIPKG